MSIPPNSSSEPDPVYMYEDSQLEANIAYVAGEPAAKVEGGEVDYNYQ